MPELPEVETVVRDLRPLLVKRRLQGVRVGRQALRRPWSPRWTKALAGRQVEEVRRRGKWIVVGLQGDRQLVFHLGMTGQLVVAPAESPCLKHTHLIFSLDDGRQLRFRDIRRFGSATLFITAAEVERYFAASGLGPEPFDLEAGYWGQRLAAARRCLKAILLDQRVLAGVGNIYADESLFEARLHPRLQGHDLNATQAQRLRRAVAAVLQRAIDKRGSSISDYVDGTGQKGNYQNEFRVYGRTGQPCHRCQTPIERLVLAGRSTHFCPHCQVGP